MDPAADRRLGRAAIIITALVIAIVAITAVVARRTRAELDIEIPAAWRSQSNFTLIIFGRESCPACAASAAFHRELAAAAEANGVRAMAASTSSTEDPAAFAASIGVAPEHALGASPAPKHLTTIPAIVIVTRDGKILRKTEGVLTDDAQRALVTFVMTLR